MTAAVPPLRHELRVAGDTVTALLAGEIDFASAPELQDWLSAEITARPGCRVLVDLGEVGFIDSSAIHVFVRVRKLADTVGSRMRLVNTDGMVQRVLQVAGVYAHLCGDPTAG
ncbi:STAS domain-containing protein [Catellatospora tritici]|uniref:STAS domain-containing protein n=1 Tax=Catellatospora tritici TaxID=2851566 RepID=UPI001C2D430F|nr:STAS domain-containing protein [Catellatospora tritici]MBV1853857.1 STAS domain-containing protein [Catellatospora tritici]